MINITISMRLLIKIIKNNTPPSKISLFNNNNTILIEFNIKKI